MAIVRIDLEVGTDGVATIKQVEGGLRSLDAQAKQSKDIFHSIFQGIGQGVGQEILSFLKTVGMATIQAAGQFEQTKIAFTTMLGSGKEAKSFLDELQAFAARTPFEFPDLVGASQKLLAMGFAAKDVIPTMTAIGDAVAGLGGGKEMIDGVTTALGQMKAKGKVSAEEMMQLAERGIPAWKFLADAIGTSIPDAMAKVTKGAVSAQTGIDAILKGMANDFGGLMDKQSQTLLGRLSTLKDNVSFIARDFGDALLPIAGEAIDAFSELLPTIQGAMPAVQDFVAAVAEVGTEILKLAGLLIGPIVSAFNVTADVTKTITFGLVDFKTALANAGLAGDALRVVWLSLKNIAVDLALAFLKARQAMAIIAGEDSVAVETEKSIKALEEMKLKFSDAANAIVSGTKEQAAATDEATQAVKKLGVQHTATATLSKEAIKAQKAAAAEAKKEADAYAQFLIRTHRLAAKEDADFWEEQRKRAEVTIDHMAKHHLEVFNQMKKVEQENAKVFAEMYRKAGDQVAGIFDMVASHIGGVWGGLFRDLGNLLATWTEKNKAGLGDWVATHQKAITAVVAGIQTVYSAYQGGVQSKSPGKGALAGAGKGAATGAAVGAMFGGVGAVPGAIIGGVVGGLAGFLGGKKGQAMELAGLRQEFDALMRQAQAAGVVFDHVFNPKNAQQYKAAIDEVKRSLDTNAQAQEALTDALGRYNFTLAEQGPILAQQQLDQQMGQIYQDWQVLTAAGIDHQAMLREMGPAVGGMVEQYAAAGVAIPAAMQPIIEELFRSGQLVHANGDAYTEAEVQGLTYTQTMSEMFQTLIEKVDRLVSALLGIPTNITTTHTINTVRNGASAGDEFDDGGRDGDPFTRAAVGFHGMVTGPRLFLAGESGAERVDIGPGGGAGNGMTEETGQALLAALQRMPKKIARSSRDLMMVG